MKNTKIVAETAHKKLIKNIYSNQLNEDEKLVLIKLVNESLPAQNIVSRALEVNRLYLLGHGLHKSYGKTGKTDGAYLVAGRNLGCSADAAFKAYQLVFKLPSLR